MDLATLTGLLGAFVVVRVSTWFGGPFGSGAANLNLEFVPVMAQLREARGTIDGCIAVQRHTDDRPIATAELPSNWHLSEQRAISVAHELLREGTIPDDRFMVIVYADTKPLS